MVVRDLGHVDYLSTIEAMKAFTQARGVETPDELWVLEHPPVFTQGIAGKEEHLLAPGEIEVAESARAHSYYSIRTGSQIGEPSAVPFVTPVSKSVLYTLCRLLVSKSVIYIPHNVKKCLPHFT